MTPSETPADPTPEAVAAPAGPAKHPIDTGEIDRLVDGAHHSRSSVVCDALAHWIVFAVDVEVVSNCS